MLTARPICLITVFVCLLTISNFFAAPAEGSSDDGKAYNPMPINGATALSEPLQLSWTAGDWTQSTGGHRVYFGTNYTYVILAGTGTAHCYRGTVSTPSYPMSRLYPDWTLTPNTTYYWRVDEVNNTTVYSGPVWSFTPAPYINIDDFEDYNSTDDINANWLMGYDVNCSGAPVPASGSLSFVLDANGKHGNFYYNEKGGTQQFSEVKRSYIGGTVFSDSSVLSSQPTELRVDYIGAATNATDPCYDRMYVAFEDSAGNIGVYNNPDGNAAQAANWTQWYVSLKDIHSAGEPNVVQLAAVSVFYLGFGERCLFIDSQDQGGDGNVMFDNIRLLRGCDWPGGALSADFDGDCYVDLDDLMVMAQEWLTYNPPCSGGPCPGVILQIADLNHDYIVDFKDFAILGQEWRVQILWP